MPKVLLAEDDRKLADLIVEWLEAENYTVEFAINGNDATHLLKISQFDILILDWDLPFVSGLDLCKEYRKSGGAGRVLMLTGKNTIDHKEQGLDAGADDYLTKPFVLRELSARLRALLRRPTQIVHDVLTARGITLDKKTWTCTRNDKPVALFPKEALLLEFFMRHPNQIFDIESLQQRIWPSESESSPETLRVHIARLRSKLEKSDERPIIKTVHRQGYLFDETGD